jgi:3-hydroxyisobutyrate dehydrogenase-like beta-hydroxyacid dehydrogenase
MKDMLTLDQNTGHQKPGRLGFIGLGYMGSRIAKRLLNAGYPLIVFNRDRAKAEALRAEGAEVAADLSELASKVDVIFSCLADEKAVQAVYLNSGGVLDYVRQGTIAVDMSTLAPDTAQQLSDAGRKRAIDVLDLAISGSTPAAESGTLILFAGGDRRVFEAVSPILPAISKQSFYMGPSGSGLAMKLVVNTLLGVGMQAIAEALALGTGLGLQHDLLCETLGKTAVVAPAHIGKLANAKADYYPPQFPVRLMHKDFDLIIAKAVELGIAMPATAEAAKMNALEAAADMEEDFSAVVRLMQSEGQKLPGATRRHFLND